MALRNRMTVPAGMLHPAGLDETVVNPNVQATTRPAGTLLRPSPGYNTVREGKNIFQGAGPTGGFRPMEFAEDVSGSGAALSVVPGDVSTLPDTEYLPDAVLVADRKLNPGWASWLHEGMGTMPDMGDRTAARPLSTAFWQNLNPTSVLRSEYQKSPVLSVLMGAGLVYVVYLLGSEFERQVKSDSRGGVGSAVTSVPASAAQTTGDVTSDTIKKIGDAGDNAVKAIENATDKAIDAIESTTKEVTD